MLRRRVHLTLTEKPTLEGEHEDFIQILTPEGRQVADMDFSYSPLQEELVMLDAEVVHSDGRRVRLSPDEIRDAGDAPIADYPGSRRKFFSLPGVIPGAVVHVRYRREWRDYPMPYVALGLPLGDEVEIVEASVEVTVPRGASFHFERDRVPDAEPRVQQTPHGTTYAWQFRELPAVPVEELSPPGPPPSLRISTWPDWRAYQEWCGRVIRRSRELTPELSAKAAELTRGARTDLEKVRAVYHYVADLRYVMVPLGVNSYRPHAAAGVLRNQFGDCKDKANLFNALLDALGLEASLVLVPRFSQVSPTLPGEGLNHAISRVRLGADTLWVDTTDAECPFGLLPPGDAGRRVLVVDGPSAGLTALPDPSPDDHRLELQTDLDWPAPGQPARLSVRAKAAGFPDYEWRRMAARPGVRRGHEALIDPAWRLSAGEFVLAQQRFTPPSRLEEPFGWEAGGECLGLTSRSEYGQLCRVPFWIPREWGLALQPRAGPLHLNQGYPLRLVQSVRLSLPATGRMKGLPALAENTVPPLRWKLDWVRGVDATLEGRLEVELVRGDIPFPEVATVQRQVRDCLEALANAVVSATPSP